MYNNIAALWKKTKTFVAVATIWLSNGGYPIRTVLKSNQNDGAKNRLMMCHHEWCCSSVAARKLCSRLVCFSA